MLTSKDPVLSVDNSSADATLRATLQFVAVLIAVAGSALAIYVYFFSITPRNFISPAIIGALGGGWLADRWMRKTERGRIYVSALGMACIIPAMFGVGYAPQTGLLWVAIAFLILFGLGWGFFDCNNMPILCQITRPELRATGYGIMNLVSISAGGLADWGFGIMRDRQVPLAGIFSVFACAALVSVVLVLLIRPRDTESPFSP